MNKILLRFLVSFVFFASVFVCLNGEAYARPDRQVRGMEQSLSHTERRTKTTHATTTIQRAGILIHIMGSRATYGKNGGHKQWAF